MLSFLSEFTQILLYERFFFLILSEIVSETSQIILKLPKYRKKKIFFTLRIFLILNDIVVIEYLCEFFVCNFLLSFVSILDEKKFF